MVDPVLDNRLGDVVAAIQSVPAITQRTGGGAQEVELPAAVSIDVGMTGSEAASASDRPARIERFGLWLVPRWPDLLTFVGFVLFVLACIASQRLPGPALYIGPAIMFAGQVLRRFGPE